MKPILFALFTMWLMGLHNVVIKLKLTAYDPLVIAALFYFGALPLVIAALIGKRMAGFPIIWPTEWPVYGYALLGGLLYVLADYCYLSAYQAGGDVMSITSIAILLPVFSVVIISIWLWRWEMPNSWEITGYVLIVAGILAIAKGGALNRAAEQAVTAL